jgi:zinc transport system substrate-binding protein
MEWAGRGSPVFRERRMSSGLLICLSYETEESPGMKDERCGLSSGKVFRIFLVSLLWVTGIPVSSSGQSPPPKLQVISSLFPLQEFARAVGGDRVRVDLLLPPGAEPHHWEPKPSEVARIYKADLFIYNGPAMEPWVENFLKGAKTTGLRTVEASRGLPLLEASPADGHAPGKAENFDPHFWLDFSLDRKVLEGIAAAFSEKDPSSSARYRANAAAYQARLDSLDQKYRSGLDRCRHRRIIFGGHSAFAYLAKRYWLHQSALYGLNPNAEPTPKRLGAVLDAVKKEGVKFIFFEGLVNPRLARMLAEEAGIGTLPLYDGANLTRAQAEKNGTFLGLMETNLESLRKGLECE